MYQDYTETALLLEMESQGDAGNQHSTICLAESCLNGIGKIRLTAHSEGVCTDEPEVRQSRARKCANRCMFFGEVVKARHKIGPTERVRPIINNAGRRDATENEDVRARERSQGR